MRVRSREELAASGDLHWFAPAMERLRSLSESADTTLAEYFAAGQPLTIARAPGRLDVMGGIADYSGSLVLEMPLACATFAIAQQQQPRRLDVVSMRDGGTYRFSIELDLILSGTLSEPAALADWFRQRQEDRWAAYIVGCVHRCLTLLDVSSPSHGLRLLISSEVPEGKGVSSSAALEVAVMAATVARFGLTMDAVEIATACQWAENRIAGAPCGIMDQMTSALGQRDRLLRLLCQPAQVEGHVEVPPGYRFYGIDSGIRHAVTGADYGTVRAAAFMGYRMIADVAGLPCTAESEVVRVSDDRWGGYLANIDPDEFGAQFADRLPARMLGGDFLARYAGITDTVTRVEPDRWYPVRAATAHPIHEHASVTRFAELLGSGLDDGERATQLGELMLGSHASYGMCGLGSDGTDRLVSLVMEAGPRAGLFGAKITGGGSGGTVAILGTDAAQSAVHHIARTYERETGRAAVVFDGSGPGAAELGIVRG